MYKPELGTSNIVPLLVQTRVAAEEGGVKENQYCENKPRRGIYDVPARELRPSHVKNGSHGETDKEKRS